ELAAAGGPVVDQAAAAAAQLAAFPQPGVQLVEQLGMLLDVADLVIAEGRADGPLDVPEVHAAGSELQGGRLHDLVEEAADLRLPVLRLPAGRHLGDQPVAYSHGRVVIGGLPVRVGVTLGDRVPAVGDGHLVPGTVPADVPLGFSHGQHHEPIAKLTGN